MLVSVNAAAKLSTPISISIVATQGVRRTVPISVLFPRIPRRKLRKLGLAAIIESDTAEHQGRSPDMPAKKKSAKKATKKPAKKMKGMKM